MIDRPDIDCFADTDPRIPRSTKVFLSCFIAALIIVSGAMIWLAFLKDA